MSNGKNPFGGGGGKMPDLGALMKQAQKLQASRPRALVAENLKQTKDYIRYYPELKSYLK